MLRSYVVLSIQQSVLVSCADEWDFELLLDRYTSLICILSWYTFTLHASCLISDVETSMPQEKQNVSYETLAIELDEIFVDAIEFIASLNQDYYPKYVLINPLSSGQQDCRLKNYRIGVSSSGLSHDDHMARVSLHSLSLNNSRMIQMSGHLFACVFQLHLSR